MINFSKIPFVRLLIPFIFGIVICTLLNINRNVLFELMVIFVLMLFLFFYNSKKAKPFISRVFILISDVFLLYSAIYSCYYTNPKNNLLYYGHYLTKDTQVWTGEIVDLPIEKEKFIKVIIKVKSIGVTDAKNVDGNVLVYFKKPIDKNALLPGNNLSINSDFLTINEPLNQEEFNYKKFLAIKGINYQSFVQPENFKVIHSQKAFSIHSYGLEIKSKIIRSFNSGRLDSLTAQLCTALLTGYDDEINSETVNAFAHSGTLHVLSVSGLHTGILFAVIVFLLGLIDKHKKHKKMHLAVLLLTLWFFVLITGFSPPVLRASVMLSFLSLGKYLYNYFENVSLNILAVSAFVILLFNPLLINDIGFLLSYTAVLGILLFGPYIEALFKSNNKFLTKIWQLSAISVAAQLSTLPVTLLFFHQFPLWFVFSNLLVIPLCTMLMLLGLLFLLKFTFLAGLINKITSFVFYIIDFTDVPDWGYIDKIDFNLIDMLFLSVIIASVSLLIKFRTYSLAKATLLFVILWQMFILFDVIGKKRESFLAIYHINKASAIDLKNANQVFYSSSADNRNYDYHVKNNQTTYNYGKFFNCPFSFIKTNEFSFLQIKNKNDLVLVNFLKPQFVLFSYSPELDDDFAFSYTPSKVIVDGSNLYNVVKSIKEFCIKNELPYYSTRENGFIKLNLYH